MELSILHKVILIDLHVQLSSICFQVPCQPQVTGSVGAHVRDDATYPTFPSAIDISGEVVRVDVPKLGLASIKCIHNTESFLSDECTITIHIQDDVSLLTVLCDGHISAIKRPFLLLVGN